MNKNVQKYLADKSILNGAKLLLKFIIKGKDRYAKKRFLTKNYLFAQVLCVTGVQKHF